ncbi:MAG: GNAT family N-acetyltransferase [Bacteroidia bacterium]|nr:GNAT family N-acetyltransferase [Bacteroidia bacterium]
MMIEFKNIKLFEPGIFQTIVKSCYNDFLKSFPDEKENFYNQWEQEDKDVFENLDTIGQCTFITCIDDTPVGCWSYDPRQHPIGIIGQNCILPQYQNKGYGERQIQAIIEIFKKQNYKEIKVSTGDNEFFLPAQRIYEKCGFVKIGFSKGELFDLIEFKKRLQH